jgi:predicted kinase
VVARPVTIPNVPLPDPAVVVLIGAAGSGKSTWASAHYRRAEIVSSDDLRGVVGSGPADLDASADAFDLLERIVTARTSRELTTVIDTLGLDATRRDRWRTAARAAGLPAVAVVLDTPGPVCRRRNAVRDRRVPAPTLTDQVRRVTALRDSLAAEGWDHVEVVSEAGDPAVGSQTTVLIDPKMRFGTKRHHGDPPTGCGWSSSSHVSRGGRTPAGGSATWRWRPTGPGSPGWR